MEFEEICKLVNGSSLPRKAISDCYIRKKFDFGIEFSMKIIDEIKNFHLLFTVDHPFLLPKIVYCECPQIGRYPHIEEYGILCLPLNTKHVPCGKFKDYLEAHIADAKKLLEDAFTGEMDDDLLNEAHSYWSHESSGNSYLLESLDCEEGMLYYYTSKRATYIASSKNYLERWFKAFGVSTGQYVSDNCYYLPLERPLYPAEYPENLKQLEELLASDSRNGLTFLQQQLRNNAKILYFVLSADTENGRFLGVLELKISLPPASYGRQNPQSHINNGFRDDKVPLKVLEARSNQFAKINRMYTLQVDHDWIHSRGQQDSAKLLKEKSVAFIGCGSLGSHVGRLLVQAGLKKIAFIDGELLAPVNTSRHTLGMAQVSQNKAVALKKRLQEDFPHQQDIQAYGKDFQHLTDSELESILSYEHIVVSIGEMGVEKSITRILIEKGFQGSVIYTWLEPYAVGGHAISFPKPSNMFLEHGQSHLYIGDFSDKTTTVTEPACGNVFQPYGCIDLSHMASLISEYIIETVFQEKHVTRDVRHLACSGSNRLIHGNNGTWSPEWVEKTQGAPEYRRLVIAWNPNNIEST